MNNELIPGKLYELLEDVDIRTNIDVWESYIRVKKGNVILVISMGPSFWHKFVYKNNICCFQWLKYHDRLLELLKLVV